MQNVKIDFFIYYARVFNILILVLFIVQFLYNNRVRYVFPIQQETPSA
jgi:hypothetical protein